MHGCSNHIVTMCVLCRPDANALHNRKSRGLANHAHNYVHSSAHTHQPPLSDYYSTTPTAPSVTPPDYTDASKLYPMLTQVAGKSRKDDNMRVECPNSVTPSSGGRGKHTLPDIGVCNRGTESYQQKHDKNTGEGNPVGNSVYYQQASDRNHTPQRVRSGDIIQGKIDSFCHETIRKERRGCGDERSLVTGGGEGYSQGPISVFCHNCGDSYPLVTAKFCCRCGTERIKFHFQSNLS